MNTESAKTYQRKGSYEQARLSSRKRPKPWARKISDF
nr:MAG TPA: hypothetical protein [Bacteriophage sp.]DAH86617.1 MAG TPA: hypothetical protein [Bacteriophage sp.]DAJ93713.1 MAG TPA: hypothetical protein [Bacteriophage sp.]